MSIFGTCFILVSSSFKAFMKYCGLQTKCIADDEKVAF